MNDNKTTDPRAALAERIVNRFLVEAIGSQSIPLEWLHLGRIIIEELERAGFTNQATISWGAMLIAKERERQIEGEGWTTEYDDEWPDNTLAYAALCYLVPDAPETVMSWWPWDLEWWKPKGRVSNLVRAGALIAAELDKLNRAGLEHVGPKPHDGEMTQRVNTGLSLDFGFHDDPRRASGGYDAEDFQRPDYDAETGNPIPDSYVPPRDWEDEPGGWVTWVGPRSWPGDGEGTGDAEELQAARAKALEASSNPRVATFNAGYDDYPENSNPFEPGHRLHQWYEYGQTARQGAEEGSNDEATNAPA